MKNIKTLSKLILLFLVSTLTMPTYSQGVAIYKKDGTMAKYAYEEIDSIVTYNYNEEPDSPSTPDTPVTPPSTSPYEAVDLGLSVKWATFNVGATKPEEYGGYYAWGETEEKFYCDWGTYKWCNGSYTTMTKYCTNSGYGTIDNRTTLDPEDDVAHVKWGGSWRLPTRAELYELQDKCTWQWTTQNGVTGYKIKSKINDNCIFLPTAGCRADKGVQYIGTSGCYWSSSLYDNESQKAFGLYISTGYRGEGGYSRSSGYSVRPVCE